MQDSATKRASTRGTDMSASRAPSRLPDIKPQTSVAALDRSVYQDRDNQFRLVDVAPLVGMSAGFIHKICGRKPFLSIRDVLALLDQDAFGETFVPRSKIVDYLLSPKPACQSTSLPKTNCTLFAADALDVIYSLPDASIHCVVTSTPYWALRLYRESVSVSWADGAVCPYGHEQTPEEFIRHTAQILYVLKRVLSEAGSIWWNVMDTFNTRTQIRSSAAEALKAMQGKDSRSWRDHECRRYSAGHSYLKDGEQCLIPARIAERASRMGYFVKTVITWAKTGSLPEPQDSRVSRNLEYVLHLTKTRTPQFDKSAYRTLPPALGGRNNGWEADKLSDVWILPTSSGRDGHGAQFPVALPGRCIGVSTQKGDIVLDPFVGAGNAGVAALQLARKFIGIDVSREYLSIAARKLAAVTPRSSRVETIIAQRDRC